jgi:hypothetical protein
MKKILCLTILLANAIVVSSRDYPSLLPQTNLLQAPDNFNPKLNSDNSISRFALSVNPLGFVEFGPLVSAEWGLTGNLVLNAHVRFATLGVLTYVVKDDDGDLDELTGMAYGGGMLYFFGDKRNKPYLGMMGEYEQTQKTYAKNEDWEAIEDDESIIIMFNGGYRFRFNSGFFINTGAFFGVSRCQWFWRNSDGSDPSEGVDYTPAGLVEVTIGFEF